MLQLHLSQSFLATTGVVAAFLGLPPSMVDIDQPTIIDPIAEQHISQEREPEPGPSESSRDLSENIKPLPDTGALLILPSRIGSFDSGGWGIPRQTQESVLMSLIERKITPSEITPSPAAVANSEEPIREKSIETKAAIIGSANRVVVPSVGIDIGVQTGSYDSTTNSWQVDDSSAFYAATTVPVNDTNGTTLIYGHAKWGVFGALPDIQVGAEASVYTAEGRRFVYTLESTEQVDPSDVSMLTIAGSPKLVLQTCSGFFDQHRTLATFQLKEIVQG